MKKLSIALLLLLFSLPAFCQGPGLITGQITTSGAACVIGSNPTNCVILQLSTQTAQVAITVGPSTFAGTLQFEVSPDGGTTWVSVSANPQPSGAGVTSTTANGVWVAPVGGMSFIRVRASAFASGVATVSLNPSQAVAAGSSSGSTTGTVNSGTANQLAIYASTGTAVSGDATLTDSGTELAYTGTGFTLPAGTCATEPPFRMGAMATNTGLCAPSATAIGFYVTGTQKINFSSAAFEVSNTQPIAISSTTTSTGAADLSFSRSGVGIAAIGNGTNGDTTGKVKAAGYMSVGTTFTSNAGCTDTVLTGGATAGKFTSGATGACTTIITFGNTATAPNGWVCTGWDLTTVADLVSQVTTAAPTTSASLHLSASAPADVIAFSCSGY